MNIKIHSLLNNQMRFRWDTINNVSFNNGIYVVFEDGESYHGMDRIVRVGTHESDGRLLARLKNHFISENKDGSIFRKNIGKAILKKVQNPYLEIWSKNSSNRRVMKNVIGYDSVLQRNIESLVSEYMCNNLTFVCFPIETKIERLRLEEGIIALLNHSSDFSASSTWLGNYSPEAKIVNSGMWLKRGLKGRPLTEQEYENIEMYCSDHEQDVQ